MSRTNAIIFSNYNTSKSHLIDYYYAISDIYLIFAKFTYWSDPETSNNCRSTI